MLAARHDDDDDDCTQFNSSKFSIKFYEFEFQFSFQQTNKNNPLYMIIALIIFS